MRGRRFLLWPCLVAMLACERDAVTTQPAVSAQLRLEVVSWDSTQVVRVDQSIAAPRVRVVDENGTPQAGVAMQYAFVEQVPRFFTVLSSRTDASGTWGPTVWTPSRRAGHQAVLLFIPERASAAALRFGLDIRPGVPDALDLDGDSIAIALGESTEPLVLTGVDAFGNRGDYTDQLVLSTEDPSIAELTADGRLRGVAEGRSAFLMQFLGRRYAALAIVGNPSPPTVTPLLANGVSRMELDSGGRIYAIGWDRDVIYRLDTASDVVDSVALTTNFEELAVSPDGSQLALITAGGDSVHLMSTASFAITNVVPVLGGSARVGYSHDGAFVLAPGSFRLTRIEVATGDTAQLPAAWDGRSGRISAIAVHPSRPELFVAQGGVLYRMDYLTGQLLSSGGGGNGVTALRLDAARNRLYASGTSGFDVAIFDATTLQTIERSPAGIGIGVEASPDGSRVYVVGSNALRIYGPSLALPLESISFPAAVAIVRGSNGDLYVGTILAPGLWRVARE